MTKSDITSKLLYLWKLLEEGEYSKSDIILKFEKEGIKINKTSVSNYIRRLKKADFPIKIKKIANKNLYSFDKDLTDIHYSQEELELLSSLKAKLISTKSVNKLKALMRVFYKFAYLTKNMDSRMVLCDFGMYSKINRHIVKELEQHCKTKNTIKIEYYPKNSEKRIITLQCDHIKIGDFSEKLYLVCIFEGHNKYSYLPIVYIKKISKVIKENSYPELKTNTISYKISKNSFEKIEHDKTEKITNLPDDFVLVETVENDNFKLPQRILSHAPDLYFIQESKTKDIIKDKLLKTWRLYEK